MPEHTTEKNPWEDAYMNQCRDAAVGRLFQGLIHNLNGIIHAFFMQTELAGMMYSKADNMLGQLIDSFPDESALEHAVQLQKMMAKRAGRIGEVTDKLKTSQDIIRRTEPLSRNSKPDESKSYGLNEIVSMEIELLTADSFFKHNVTKNINLADNLPPLNGFQPDLHFAFFSLIENALEELKPSSDDPDNKKQTGNSKEASAITIETACINNMFVLSVQDMGPGIAESDLNKIFDPFFTTKKNHAGLGLYLAKQAMDSRGGEISCKSSPGSTRFDLSFPTNKA